MVDFSVPTKNLIGPQTLADGAQVVPRGERTGATVTQDAHGRYTEAVKRGNVFIAHNVAAQAVSVALATTYTGLVLSNPLGSGKDLYLMAAQFAISVAEVAIATQHLIGGYSATTAVTHTTPLAAPGIQNAYLGAGNAPVGKVDSAATIPTPGYLLPLRSGFTAGALGGPGMGQIADLGGLIIIPPGGFVAIGALTSVTGFGALVWEEQPV
jgi:hypothetical protein